MKQKTNIIGEMLGRDWAGLTRYQLVALAREALAELEARSDSLGDDISADHRRPAGDPPAILRLTNPRKEKSMKTQPKQPPRPMQEVRTYGGKLRFQAHYDSAPLRKSAWSAWADQAKHDGTWIPA
jgi:hypothetical protein